VALTPKSVEFCVKRICVVHYETTGLWRPSLLQAWRLIT